MVDFCISGIRYDEKKQHITFVKVHERQTTSQGWGLGPARIVPRAFVADLIRMNKASFETVVKVENNKVRHGAHVHVIDDVYLSTDRNSTKRDNLSNMPEF
jgi:hypothetical protein